MALGTNSEANSNIAVEDPLAPTILPESVIQDMTNEQMPQQNPYSNYEAIPIQQCVTQSDEPGAPESYFVYGVIIGFDSPEDQLAYQRHPDRGEIENTIAQAVMADGEETLRLEMNRDEDTDVYPDAGHDSFNENTILDFAVTVDNTIPMMNEAYGTNISGGFVSKESAELPPIVCESSEPLPDNVASTSYTNTSAYKM